MFVDRVKIHVKGGDGGDGKVSFYRAKYITHGGPDGGDGGKGGNVVFVGESGMSTLMDFRYKRKFVATPGEPGGKRNCFGKDGEDIIIKVPVGTVIREAESGKVMADITTAGEKKSSSTAAREARAISTLQPPPDRPPDMQSRAENPRNMMSFWN